MKLMSALLAFALLLSTAYADVTTFSVLPSETSDKITLFDLPHWIYVDRDILVTKDPVLPKDRHQLLLFLTGTGGNGHGAVGFCHLGAALGYHVISLMYPDDIPASTCDYDPNPDGFEAFRLAVIQGGSARQRAGRMDFVVDRAECIENRLIQLLLYLQKRRPKENWDQFLNPDTSIKWERVAVAGQSQGGGHAALIGIKHQVARVLCFGSPKDYSTRFNAPAAWYGEPSATPKGLFFAFNHVQDPKGCTPAKLYRNLQALGLEALSPAVSVDQEDFPYHHARILYTAYPSVYIDGQNSLGAGIAHNSAIATVNADRWKQVWTYMLTEPSP